MASFKNLVSTTSAQISSGGTITGDLVINGDLQVDGGGSLSFDEIIQGTQVIDVDNTEALLVRKDGDNGDVFTVDTTNMDVTVNGVKNTTTFLVTNNWSTTNDYIRIALNDATIRSTVLDSGARNLILAPLGNDALTLHSTSSGVVSASIGTNSPDGTLHVHTATAGSVTVDSACDDLVVENNTSGGISILTPNDSLGQLAFGSPADAYGAFIGWKSDDNQMTIATANAGDSIVMQTANKVTALTIDSSQNVGIGTSTPSSFDSEANNLVVGNGSGDNGITIFTGSSAGHHGSIFFGDATGTPKQGQIRYEQNNEVMSFHTNTTERMRIDLNGNVGIGISPVASQKLHVNVASNVNFTTSANSSSLRLNAVNDAVDATIPLEINSTNTQFLSSSVGIGTSPSANLHILNSSGAGHLILETTSASHGVMLDLRGSADRDAEIIFREGSNAKAIIFNDASNNSLSLSDGSGGLSPVLNIKTGSVGIGCDHPSVPLEVELSGDTGTYFEGGGSGNGTSDARHLTIAASTTTNAGDTHTLNAESATGVLKFATTGTNRMILDSNSRISLSNNDGGAGNTVFGELAGNALASGGNYNLLIGKEAGNDLTTSDHNVAIGFQTLSKATANLDGNTAVGNYAMGSVVSNDVNNCTAIGYASMSVGVLESTASGTVAVGFGTLDNLTSGAGNIAVGYLALNSMTSGGSNVAIGDTALQDLVTGGANVAIGRNAGKEMGAGENGNILIGMAAGQSLDEGTSGLIDSNIAIGKDSFIGGNLNTASTVVKGNIAIGTDALNSTGTNAQTGTIAIGHEALTNNVNGARNTVIGYQGMLDGTGAGDNVAIGYEVLKEGTTSELNVAVGTQALGSNSASALTGNANVAVGYQALYVAEGDSKNNVAIGRSAGDSITTGQANVIIGSEASANGSGAINRIAIGRTATAVADNSVTLGNASVTAVYMAQDSGATVHADKYMSTTMPAFLVQPNAEQTNIAVDTVTDIVFDVERFDQGSNFASNTFTAPVTGKYFLNVSLYGKQVDSASDYIQVYIVTSNRTYTMIIDPDFGQDAAYWSFNNSVLADMDVNDTAKIQVFQSTGSAQLDIGTASYFSGYLVC